MIGSKEKGDVPTTKSIGSQIESSRSEEGITKCIIVNCIIIALTKLELRFLIKGVKSEGRRSDQGGLLHGDPR